MATSLTPQTTDFTRDVIGRYVCNGLDEALRSTDTTLRPDARPFDIIVLGGGTFGSAVAQHLFNRDKTRNHRILVLEGGPFVLTEHVQNLPMLGLGVPGPTSIADLRMSGQDGIPRNEVWGLPWHSNVQFPGLAYCNGGRSLFWGGWSPQLLDSELPTSGTAKNLWPNPVVTALNTQYFGESSEQIGVTETNDFIDGALHRALRKQLFEGITANQVTDAIPLAQLPLHLVNPPAETPPVPSDALKLEAPLGVQSRAPRAGFFPFNKFSAVPLLMRAVRSAQAEANNDDVKKRLMVVPKCHVKQLVTVNGRVTQVQTSLGNIPVPPNGIVIMALATIETTRLALLSFQGIPNYNLIGKNLMAHLRSNLDIRVPRSALTSLDPVIKELQTSALFVKGRHTHPDGTVGHFHLQITASGLGVMGADSEAELFKKVPDIDGFEPFRTADDTHVVITMRGIGEMEPQNPNNFVKLDPELDEFGVPRAFVSLQPSSKDLTLWDAMDQAADDVAKIFGVNQGQVLSKRRDGLGTTHHETGTLWMGDNPTLSVTNASGQFHHVANAYVVGPAILPNIGSPNPMLTGIALARRLGDQLINPPTPPGPSDGFQLLFDGVSPTNWQMSTIQNQPPGRDNPGTFIVVDGVLQSVPGNDLGLFWCKTPTPPDFILKLEWRRSQADDNSGVFIRFPDPNSKGYDNTAFVGVNFGFEVQIDELGAPDGAAIHKTGAIYNEPIQTLTQQPAKPLGEWNEYEIRVQGQTYTVLLNGTQVTTFQNTNPNRGLPSTPTTPSFIGLQVYPGKHVAFRNIRIKAL
jgi:choline dehydrogenase-like flavoprotein